MRNHERPLPDEIKREIEDSESQPISPEKQGSGKYGGYSLEELQALRSRPDTAEYERALFEMQRDRKAQEGEEKEKDWRAKYPKFAQLKEGFLGSKTREMRWYDVTRVLEAGKASPDLLQAALEHPHPLVVREAATRYRLTPEQLTHILAAEYIPDWNKEQCVEAQLQRGMTQQDVAEVQEAAEKIRAEREAQRERS